jgi:hypothetical protein
MPHQVAMRTIESRYVRATVVGFAASHKYPAVTSASARRDTAVGAIADRERATAGAYRSLRGVTATARCSQVFSQVLLTTS